MERAFNPLHVAVVGTGMAGAWCARRLADAGHRVQAFDKSRGPGGRLATRDFAWTGPNGVPRRAGIDHGSPMVHAAAPAFRAFVDRLASAGGVVEWRPRLAPGSRPCASTGPLWVGLPDSPSICRGLLRGVGTRWLTTVTQLQQGPDGWLLNTAEGPVDGPFDAVVLALPPAQAAPLLAAHRRDWAQRAALALMQPCWTLLGVSDRPVADTAWDLARPAQGVLSWVIRNDRRPGRAAADGEAHWVLHARAGWARRCLELPPEAVLPQMQAALHEVLGEPLAWRHAVVHRWRYAQAASAARPAGTPGWWDAGIGLGVCGDFLDGTGIEGAWTSANELADRVLREPLAAAPAPARALAAAGR